MIKTEDKIKAKLNAILFDFTSITAHFKTLNLLRFAILNIIYFLLILNEKV